MVKPWHLTRESGVRRPGMETGLLGPQRQRVLGAVGVWNVSHSLKEARLVLLLIVGPKLDLALETSKLTGLVKGDRVGAIQDVISCLENREKGGECCVPLTVPSPHLHCPRQVLSTPAHREGSAAQGPASPHSGPSRRTSSAAEASRSPPLLVPSGCGHGPASSLGHRVCSVPSPWPCAISGFLSVHVFISYLLSLTC